MARKTGATRRKSEDADDADMDLDLVERIQAEAHAVAAPYQENPCEVVHAFLGFIEEATSTVPYDLDREAIQSMVAAISCTLGGDYLAASDSVERVKDKLEKALSIWNGLSSGGIRVPQRSKD